MRVTRNSKGPRRSLYHTGMVTYLFRESQGSNLGVSGDVVISLHCDPVGLGP